MAVEAPSGPRAGFGTRLVAAIIDGVILGVVQIVLAAITNQQVGQALGLILSLGYFTYFEGGTKGQTIGKQVMKIRVIDFNGGGSIGYGRGFIRWIGRIVSSIPLLLGYFWMLWDKERQTWHDKFATAVVVPVADYPV